MIEMSDDLGTSDRQILELFLRRHFTFFMLNMLKEASERVAIQGEDGKWRRGRKHPLEIEIFIRDYCGRHNIDVIKTKLV